PLAPEEPYYPAYHVSNTYVRNVNVTNVNVTNINVTNVNVTNINYRNRRAPDAVTFEHQRDERQRHQHQLPEPPRPGCGHGGVARCVRAVAPGEPERDRGSARPARSGARGRFRGSRHA